MLFSGLLVFSLSEESYGQVSVPNTFKAGSPIRSADVNQNFQVLQSAINKVQSDIDKKTVKSQIIDCDNSTSKTPIQDYLRTAGDGWVISVSGKCDDSLVLLSYGTIFALNRASVGRLSIAVGAVVNGLRISGYVDSNGRWQGGVANAINAPFQTQLYNVEIECPRANSEGACNTGLAISSDAFLSGVVISGGWDRGMTVGYGATVRLNMTRTQPSVTFGISFKLDSTRFNSSSRFSEDIGVGFGSTLVDTSNVPSAVGLIESLNIDIGGRAFLAQPIKQVRLGPDAFLRSLSDLTHSTVTCRSAENGAIVVSRDDKVMKC